MSWFGILAVHNLSAAIQNSIPYQGGRQHSFFHLQACHRGRKNWIKKLQHEGSWFVDEEAKSQLIFDHFNSILGDYEQRNHRLDFNFLGLPTERTFQPLITASLKKKCGR
jgi:hypothetical protein